MRHSPRLTLVPSHRTIIVVTLPQEALSVFIGQLVYSLGLPRKAVLHSTVKGFEGLGVQLL